MLNGCFELSSGSAGTGLLFFKTCGETDSRLCVWCVSEYGFGVWKHNPPRCVWEKTTAPTIQKLIKCTHRWFTHACVTRRVQLSPPTIPYDGVHHLLRPRPKKNQKTSPEIRRRRSTRTGVQNLRQVGFALSNKKALARLYIKLEVDNGTYDTAYAIPHPLTMYLNALLVLAIACVTHQWILSNFSIYKDRLASELP